jgi:hypothetical protein
VTSSPLVGFLRDAGITDPDRQRAVIAVAAVLTQRRNRADLVARAVAAMQAAPGAGRSTVRELAALVTSFPAGFRPYDRGDVERLAGLMYPRHDGTAGQVPAWALEGPPPPRAIPPVRQATRPVGDTRSRDRNDRSGPGAAVAWRLGS